MKLLWVLGIWLILACAAGLIIGKAIWWAEKDRRRYARMRTPYRAGRL